MAAYASSMSSSSGAVPAALRNLARIAASKNHALSSEPDRPLGRALLQRRLCQSLKSDLAASQERYEADLFARVNSRQPAYFLTNTGSCNGSSSSGSSSDEESDDEATSGLVFSARTSTTSPTTTPASPTLGNDTDPDLATLAIAVPTITTDTTTVAPAFVAPASNSTSNANITTLTNIPVDASSEISLPLSTDTSCLRDGILVATTPTVDATTTSSPSKASPTTTTSSQSLTRSVSAEELASLSQAFFVKRNNRRNNNDTDSMPPRDKSDQQSKNSPRLDRRDIGRLSDAAIHSLFTGASVPAGT